MGFKDWLGMGKKAVAENKDAVMDGIDKAADMVDDKTDGKLSEHVDKGQEAAKDMVDGLED